jgi:hypothetical protein
LIGEPSSTVTIYNPTLDPSGEARRNLTGCLLDAFAHAAAI